MSTFDLAEVIDRICDALEEPELRTGIVALRGICNKWPVVKIYLQTEPERIVRWCKVLAPDRYSRRIQKQEPAILDRIREYQSRLKQEGIL